jgi:hypothetical protein
LGDRLVRRGRSVAPVDRRDVPLWHEELVGGAGRRYYPYLYVVRHRHAVYGPDNRLPRRRRALCVGPPCPGVPVFPYGQRAFEVRPTLDRLAVERHQRRDEGWV